MKNFGTEQSFLLGGLAKKRVPGNWNNSWSKYFELLFVLTLVVTVLIASFSKRIMSKVEQELGWFDKLGGFQYNSIFETETNCYRR